MSGKFLKIAVIAVIAILALQFIVGYLIKTGVETALPGVIGADVEVGSVGLSVFTGTVDIDDVLIGNPEGFKSDHSFSLGEVYVDLDLGSLLSDTIIIEEVSVVAPEILYEVSWKGTNIGAISKNASKSSDSEAKESSKPSDDSESSDSGKKLVIEDFYIKDAVVKPAFGGSEAAVLLPNIHIEDIGKKDEGASFAETLDDVLKELTKTLSRTDLSELGSAVKEGAKSAAEAVKDGFKGAVDSINKFLDK